MESSEGRRYVNPFIKGKRPTFKSDECIEYCLNATDILMLPLLTPPYQADLNPSKVHEMIESYTKNPEFMRFKNTIVIAVSNKAMYLVDGQHRVEMMKRIPITHTFRVLLYTIQSDDDMRVLFREMNHDSHKNLAYVSLGADAARMVDEVYAYLDRKPFTKKRGESLLYTVRGFMDSIADYTRRFASSADLIRDLEEKHAAFKGNTEFINFYAEERGCVESGFVMPIKGCNFVNYLLHAAPPVYTGKGTKIYRTLPLTLKKIVWAKHVGMDKGSTKCFVCKITDIHQMSFHCGHVIPKSKGGENTPENLRPICQSCNSSMGTIHMDSFVDHCI